jgi:hypothetical protein
MNRSATGISLAVLGALALTLTANAHHGYAEYDRCEFATIEGDIARLEWANPHVILSVKAGETTYLVEWQTIDQLRRANVADGTLKVGDRIVLTGSKNRTPGLNKMTLLSAVRRPSDGWSWSRPRDSVCKTGETKSAQ